MPISRTQHTNIHAHIKITHIYVHATIYTHASPLKVVGPCNLGGFYQGSEEKEELLSDGAHLLWISNSQVTCHLHCG